MRKLLLLAFFYSITNALLSQNTFKQNNIFLEFGGNGIGLSLNYERQIFSEPGLGFRVGFGSYTLNNFTPSYPVGANYLLNLYNKKLFADFGFGVTYVKADVKLYVIVDRKEPYENTNYFNYIPSAGLRLYTKNNFLWRLSLSPIINDNGLIPFIGLSFGKMF